MLRKTNFENVPMKPQRVYQCLNRAFDDNDAVVADIRKLNASKQTKINTIAFFSPEAPASDRKVCEDVLRTIASGGIPRRVAFDPTSGIAMVTNENGWVDFIK